MPQLTGDRDFSVDPADQFRWQRAQSGEGGAEFRLERNLQSNVLLEGDEQMVDRCRKDRVFHEFGSGVSFFAGRPATRAVPGLSLLSLTLALSTNRCIFGQGNLTWRLVRHGDAPGRESWPCLLSRQSLANDLRMQPLPKRSAPGEVGSGREVEGA